MQIITKINLNQKVMKFKIKKEVSVDIKTLHIRAGVRYWEDATVNGVEDTDGHLIPCRVIDNDDWLPVIEIETGKIRNWKQGVTADIHYKVCDDGDYYLMSEDENTHEIHKNGYVPSCLSINGNGYGDYIIMKVDENGIIEDWKFDIDDFIEETD